MTSNHYEYGEVHDDDHDDDEEVELVSSGRSSSRRRFLPPSQGGRRRTLGEGGSTSSCKITGYTSWIMIIIILVFGISLVGVYNLGMKEGKKAEKMEGGSSSGQQQKMDCWHVLYTRKGVVALTVYACVFLYTSLWRFRGCNQSCSYSIAS